MYVQNAHHSREHMHSNDYATAQSLMVSVAVSSLGATQLHFLEPGVKVNGYYYRNTVLLNMLLLDIRCVFGDYYVFLQDCQDWAPASGICFRRGSTARGSMMWRSWKNACRGSRGCWIMHTVIAAAIAQWHSRLNAVFAWNFYANDFGILLRSFARKIWKIRQYL